MSESGNAPAKAPATGPLSTGRANPWLVFLLPFVVYMLVGSFEPSSPAAGSQSSWSPLHALHLDIPYSAYPLVYSLKIGLTILAIAYVWPGLRQFPLRVNWGLAIGVGVAGVVAWVGLAILQHWAMDKIGSKINWRARSAFNPLDQMADRPAWAYTFLTVRFLGLAAVVPLIEESFLRGFAMRYAVKPDWWTVPFGDANRLAIVAGTAIPLLTHPPTEALAVAVWFSGVTWLMLRTRNFWDCVLAHAITNLLLGLYVLKSGAWWLM